MIDEGRQRMGLLAALSAALAVGMTWPLVLHVGSDIPHDVYDPLYHTWQLAWIGHALLDSPLHLFQSNTYWPNKDSLAFTDAPLGYAPVALIAAAGPHAALVVHNLVFVFTYALAFLGGSLLAGELGAGLWGSLAAGASFAFAPWKLEQAGHLHVISSGAIPLSLFLLVRGYRRGRRGTILAGWLVAAWQMTLGFTLGLQLAYLLTVLAAVAGALWLRAGRPRLGRQVLVGSAAGLASFLVVTTLVAIPYLRVVHEYPEAKKTAQDVAFYSPPPRAFLSASGLSYLWGGHTMRWRKTLRAPADQSLFPGLATAFFALVGLASAAYSSRLRVGLAAATLLCAAFSLGFPSYAHPDSGFAPYRLLYDFAPGWNGVRTPGRINALTSLGLALLAGAGVALVVARLRRFRASRWLTPLAGLVVVGAILFDGYGRIPDPPVPAVPAGEATAPDPQLSLPSDEPRDAIYGYWSTERFPKIVNGAGSFDPKRLLAIRRASLSFPSAASIRYLRAVGVRSVLLHRQLAKGTPWAAVARRSTAGLAVTREDRGDLVLYVLRARPGL